MKTWTLAEARKDFECGGLRRAVICILDDVRRCRYAVSFGSTLDSDGVGQLVTGDGLVWEFKTVDAALFIIRHQVGFRGNLFVGFQK